MPQVLLSALIVPWTWAGTSVLAIAGQLAFFLLALFIARIGQTVAFNVRIYSGLSLVLGWLVYCFAVEGAPYVIEQLPVQIEGWLVFGGVWLWFMSWPWINREEVILMSTRVATNVSMRAENVETATYIGGCTGAEPHIFAIMLAGSTHVVIESVAHGVDEHGLWSAIVYLLVLLATSSALVARRLVPAVWVKRLGERRQLIKGVETQDENLIRLRVLQKRLGRREVGSQLLAFLLLILLFRGLTEQATGMHMGVVLIFLGAVGAHWARVFGQQLYRMLVSRAPMRHQLLEVADIPMEDDQKSGLERMTEWLKRHVYKVLAAGFVLLQIVHLVVRIWNYLRS